MAYEYVDSYKEDENISISPLSIYMALAMANKCSDNETEKQISNALNTTTEKLDLNRVNKTSDVVSIGDEVLAIATGYDKKGKLNLSRKELLLRNRPKKDDVKEEIKEEVVDAE